MSETVRRKVVYHGRVQGVGFRATVVDLASEFDVTGHVRNRSDGTVELVADGPIPAVEGLLMAIGDRMSRYITDAEVEEIPSDEMLSGFEIRR